MEKIKTKIRRWGNSFGVVLPKKVIEEENLKEGVEISISIEPHQKMTVEDLIQFAKKQNLKRTPKNLNTIIKEIDENLWGED